MQLLWITTLGHIWQHLKLEALIAGASVGKLKPNPACCLSVYDLWAPPEQPRTGSCEDQARVSLSAHLPTLFPVPASSDWWPCLQLPSWHLYVGDSTTGNCYTLSSGIFSPEVSNSLLNCLTSSQLPKLKWLSPPKGGKGTAGSGCHWSREWKWSQGSPAPIRPLLLRTFHMMASGHKVCPPSETGHPGKQGGAREEFSLLLYKYLYTILEFAFCPTKPKIFIIWPFTKKFANHSFRKER